MDDVHAPDCPIGADERARDRANRRNRGNGGCGCLLIILAAVVAVAGIGWNIVAGMVAPDRGLTAEQAAMVSALAGDWQGTYVCDKTTRGLDLEIKRALTKRGDLVATFTFYRTKKITGAPLGSFRLKGEYTGTHVDLRPDSWIKQPAGYRMVDLLAPAPSGKPLRMKGGVDRGRTSCSSFTIVKK
ncbi:hypothetical protein [Mangrovihabitans endophyticus]|uniref:Uncharacterized protein n=1 Tax=Mangrovihabitans endophyticus TaxID=1751298 RepID=A0A8J3BXT0_9ACTN|nr:hypothetical protein [Mangrovihabitans endophyticus]GGK77786.1 hypothetical protein GCM10012284_09660 [Mangrovihabitans endophyticus]